MLISSIKPVATTSEGVAVAAKFEKNRGIIALFPLPEPFFWPFGMLLSNFIFSVTRNNQKTLKAAPVLTPRHVTKCNKPLKRGAFCYILLQIVTRLYREPENLLHFVTSQTIYFQLNSYVTNLPPFSYRQHTHFHKFNHNGTV